LFLVLFYTGGAMFVFIFIAAGAFFTLRFVWAAPNVLLNIWAPGVCDA
jgi:hypothetical protein